MRTQRWSTARGWCHAPALVVLAFILVGTPQQARAEPEEIPMPLDRTTQLKRTDVVYVVDGRQTIPGSVEISAQKGVRIVGRNGAILVVDGSFVVHGITGTEAEVSGIHIVPGKDVKQLHLDLCDVAGTRVATEEGAATGGDITIENLDGIAIDVAMTGGKLRLMNMSTSSRVRLRGIDDGGKKNRAHINIRTSKLKGGLDCEGVNDITLRGNAVGGQVVFKDVRRLDFDANEVTCQTIAFEQSDAKGFSKTKIMKSDFIGSRIRLHAPVGSKKKVSVTFAKCYFDGETDPKKIAERIHDREDDPENAAGARIQKPSKRKIGLSVTMSD